MVTAGSLPYRPHWKTPTTTSGQPHDIIKVRPALSVESIDIYRYIVIYVYGWEDQGKGGTVTTRAHRITPPKPHSVTLQKQISWGGSDSKLCHSSIFGGGLLVHCVLPANWQSQQLLSTAGDFDVAFELLCVLTDWEKWSGRIIHFSASFFRNPSWVALADKTAWLEYIKPQSCAIVLPPLLKSCFFSLFLYFFILLFTRFHSRESLCDLRTASTTPLFTAGSFIQTSLCQTASAQQSCSINTTIVTS